MNNFHLKSLVGLILVVVVILAGFFLVKPQWSTYKVARAQLATEQQKNLALLKAQKDLNTFLDDYNKHTDEAAKINLALPLTQVQMQDVLQSFDQMGKLSGVTLADFLPALSQDDTQVAGAANSIQPVDLEITVKGSFVSFSDFLKRIESSLRIIDVKTVTVQSTEEGENTYHLKFTTYYQK